MKNFLLVIPKLAEYGQTYVFPLGMLYISACLKRAGFNLVCLNLCHHQEPQETVLARLIKVHDIQVVCTGGTAAHWKQIESLLDDVKKIDPSLITVVGGAIMTSEPELAMGHLHADIGVLGEGEETVVELAYYLSRNMSVEFVRGIVYRAPEKGALLHSEKRPPVEDLDALPLPDYGSFDYDKYLKLRTEKNPFYDPRLFEVGEEQVYGEILASRSCPYSCTFCYHPLGKKYRQRSLDDVFVEIRLLVEKFGVNFINILDELFSHDDARIASFSAEMKRLGVRWTAQWRVDNISEETLPLLKESGVSFIGLGLESASDTILKSMRKMTTREQIDRAYSLVLKHGMTPGGNLIFGDVEETDETIKESLDWWFAHPEYQVGMQFIMVLPDSALYRHALSNNLIPDKLRHVRDKLWVTNVSKLENGRFHEMQAMVTYFDHTRANLRHGRIVSSRIEEASKDKNIYNTLFECPDCGESSHYRYYYHQPEGDQSLFTIVLCKRCLSRYKVETAACFFADVDTDEDFYNQTKLVCAIC